MPRCVCSGDALIFVHCSSPTRRHSRFPGDLATSMSQRVEVVEVREGCMLAEVQSGIWPTQAVAGSVQRPGDWGDCKFVQLAGRAEVPALLRSFRCEPSLLRLRY